MARQRRRDLALVAAACILASICMGIAAKPSQVPATTDKVEELLFLQSRSSDGVIRFDTAAFNKFAAGKNRPYTLIVFLTANHLLNKPQLQLGLMRDHFGYAAKAFVTPADKSQKGKLFFVDVEFADAKEVFQRLGVMSLPYVFLINPNSNINSDGSIKVKDDAKMTPEEFGFPIKAKSFQQFVEQNTGIKAGEDVVEPSFTKSRYFPIVALAALASLVYIAYKAIMSPFLMSPPVWCVGGLFIYWFSVSGGLHNIIRGIPMFTVNPQTGKVQMFLPNGPSSQLGAEGFFVGSLYLGFSLTLASIVYLLPRLKGERVQRFAGYTLIGIASLFFNGILSVYTWKTGYSLKTYFS